MVLQRVVKPRTKRAKRALEKREPKVFEDVKRAMFIRGKSTSPAVRDILKQLCLFKKAESITYSRKNDIKPFEDATSMEFFSSKSDSSLFMYGSHSKKRPNNIVIGRLHDYHILDMVELGADNFQSMYDLKGAKSSIGMKPCIMFAGDQFDSDPEYMRLKNLFIDFFRGNVIDKISLAGLEHVMMFTAVDGSIYMRNYKILMKKSGSKTPRIELEDMGPSVDFSIRRTQLASDDFYNRALKKPKTATPKKTKNINYDKFGSRLGRVHMQKQNLDNLQTRKLKGLKTKKGKDSNSKTSTDGQSQKESMES